ncbi:MAG: class B sortase [Bacilli bacterium]|nr:class B sortase [Bacilli bacterium]
MKKQTKKFWVSYILFTIILSFSLYKITAKQINYREIESQEIDIRKLASIIEIKDMNDNTEIINPPEENIEPEEPDINIPPNDYWYYINIPLISVDFNSLIAKNNDTVAWIALNGTNINYPVVQASDNDYYLYHAYDHSDNQAGWVFMDYRNDPIEFSKNTVIYGHGMNNNTIFGTLRYITENWWYNNPDNHIVKLSTPSENTLWQVFSVYTIPEETYYIQTDFTDNNIYKEFLSKLQARSIYNFNASVNENDKIITLSSCYNNDLRVVLHAKLIKREKR